ncbi:MAG: hypothetical protein ACRD2T_16410, partial [Thermoanaerobaculia bacterium]
TTTIRMQRVRLRVTPQATIQIDSLRGRMVPTRRGEPPYFDDPTSFRIALASAAMAVDAASLTALMNDCLRRHREVPLRDVRVSAREGELRQKGTLEKGPGMSFEIRARPQVGPGGVLLLRPSKVKAGGVPVKGLMRVFGIEMESVLDLQGACGLTTEGNALLLDPGALAPPPAMTGTLTGVEVLEDRLALRFGKPPEESGSAKQTGYMDFRGGTLRFGKLTMHDTDLRLIDTDPEDPFEFYLERYLDQLVVGTSKTTKQKGLRTYLPDYGDLR